MSRIGNFMLGALAGALFAAVIVILLTPSSGSDMQKKVKNRVASIRDEMSQAAGERRKQLELELEAMRKPKK